MGWEELAAGAVGVTILGLPIIATGWLVRRLFARLRLEQQELGERGSVHRAEVWFIVAVIIFGCGAVLGGGQRPSPARVDLRR